MTTAAMVYGVFPRLETDRLVLRELTSGDAHDLFQIFSNSEVTRYYDLDTFTRMQQAAELIDRFRQRYERQIGLRWALTLKEDPGGVVGTCGYNIWIQSSNRSVLGYDLARGCWGQGLMTEALAAIIEFGFEKMSLNRIEALAFRENEASHRMLEKLGFECEGVLREYEFLKGAYVDMSLHSLLRQRR
jgi:ribosomal-protein-alanine N-acetyltransferase